MVSESTIERTRDYASIKQKDYIDNSENILNSIKTDEKLKRTISAYNGLISHQQAILDRTPIDNLEKIHSIEQKIARYEAIVSNLEVIGRIPAINDYSSADKTIQDLNSILNTDISLRGIRKDSIQEPLQESINNLNTQFEGIQITDSVLQNLESDKSVMLPILTRFKQYLKKSGSQLIIINSLINAWKKVERVTFGTLVWELKLNTETGTKHGKPNTDESPGGTYILFNVDMDKTDPKTLFGTILNLDKSNEKENIYHWFRRKFASQWSDREWAEKEKSLEISGFGYVDYKQQEKSVKWNRAQQKYIEINYPKRIYDRQIFMDRYIGWKRLWMKKIHLTDAGWSVYVRSLNQYIHI